MKKKIMIEVTEVYCDVCKQLCHNYTTITNNKKEYHACMRYDDFQNKSHKELLREQLKEK